MVDETLTHTGAAAPGAAIAPAPKVGRYLILDKLGEGGMGEVFLAFDPELERRVALKLLRPSEGDDAERHRQRLLREARAIARVRDPHVVRVHEVGEIGEQVFVAMEFVSGVPLRRWAQEHDVRQATVAEEAIELLVQAGRGLAAVHAAGLVHRDFKPSNVMVGVDGRARVIDFGLARGGQVAARVAARRGGGSRRVAVATDGELSESTPRSATPPLSDETLTRPGSLVGTPPYMAPERFEGVDDDPRSDQFAFCVAAFEVLFRRRPYAGKSPVAVLEAIDAGDIVDVENVGVPGHVRRAIVRGLAASPARRFRSMNALLETLRGRAAARRLWGAAAFMALVAAVLVLVGLRPWSADSTTPGPSCQTGATEANEVWNDSTARELVELARATEKVYAEDSIGYVTSRFDDYAARWATMRDEACAATWIDGRQSQANLDLRMECLDGRKAALGRLVSDLRNIDAENIERVTSAVEHLPELDRCADLAALSSVDPMPEDPEQVAEIRSLRERAAALDVWSVHVGEPKAALAGVDALVADAQSVGFQPAVAEAQVARAGLYRSIGSPEESLPAIEAAYFSALLAGDHRLARDTAIWMAIECTDQDWSVEAARWIEFAQASSRAIGAPEKTGPMLDALAELHFVRGDPHAALAATRRQISRATDTRLTDKADTYNALARMLRHSGDLPGAIEAQRKANQLFKEALGSNHPWVAASLMNLGNHYMERGEGDEALECYLQARVVLEANLGPEHVTMGRWWLNVGSLHYRWGRLDQAEEATRRALKIFRAGYGPQHSRVAYALTNLASIASQRGQLDSALALNSEALAMKEAVLGPQHPAVAHSHQMDSIAALAAGDLDRAEDAARQAVAIRSRDGGIALLGTSLVQLAEVLWRRGKVEEALELAQRALEWNVQESSMYRFDSEALVAELLLDLGRVEQALDHVRRATMSSDLDVEQMLPESTSRARFVEARALWVLHREHDRALALAEWAQYHVDPRAGAWAIAEIAKWRAERSMWPQKALVSVSE